MGISGFNSNPFNKMAGHPGLILRSDQTQASQTQKPPRPNKEKLAATDADFISVAASIVNPDTESNNRKNKQGFNQPRFGNSPNNRNAENVYVARMEMRGSEQRTQVTPREALEQKVDRLQGQVELMQNQLASLLGSKTGINRDLQRPNMFADPSGNRQIDVA